MGAAIFPLVAGYYTAVKCSNWSASCGYWSVAAQWTRAPRRCYPGGCIL